MGDAVKMKTGKTRETMRQSAYSPTSSKPKSTKVATHINIHMLQQVIIQDQIMCHPHPMRFHRVSYPVGKVSHVVYAGF